MRSLLSPRGALSQKFVARTTSNVKFVDYKAKYPRSEHEVPRSERYSMYTTTPGEVTEPLPHAEETHCQGFTRNALPAWLYPAAVHRRR